MKRPLKKIYLIPLLLLMSGSMTLMLWLSQQYYLYSTEETLFTQGLMNQTGLLERIKLLQKNREQHINAALSLVDEHNGNPQQNDIFLSREQAIYLNTMKRIKDIFAILQHTTTSPLVLSELVRLKLAHEQLGKVEQEIFSRADDDKPYDLTGNEDYQAQRASYLTSLRRLYQSLREDMDFRINARQSSVSLTVFYSITGLLVLFTLWIIWFVRLTRQYNSLQKMLRNSDADIAQIRHEVIQKELQRSLNLQKAILDSANVIIIVTTLEGTIRIFNSAAERLLGYNASEMIGRQTPLVLHDPEDIKRRATALSLELDETVHEGFDTLVAKARLGMVDESEWHYVCKNGHMLPVLMSVTAICDESYNVVGYLEIGTDITESKKIEQMKTDFISTVSHELRTPLTSIRGSLGLLVGGAMGDLPENVLPLLEIAEKNSDRLVRLINDILDIEKIIAGKMPFTVRTYNMATLILDAVAANQGFAGQFGIKLVFDNKAPEAMLEVDYDRIEQVLTNLLSNACKFSPKNEEVRISLEDYKQGWIQVSVKNKGPVIPENFRKRIFQKFAQADSTSDNQRKGGTGLGLNICKVIIEHFGGIIDFESQENYGTSFYFRLKVADKSRRQSSKGVSNGRAGIK